MVACNHCSCYSTGRFNQDKSKVRFGQYFGFMMTETSDKCKSEPVSMYLCYVFNDGTKEYFIEFFSTILTVCKTLYKLVEEAFMKYEIDIKHMITKCFWWSTQYEYQCVCVMLSMMVEKSPS